jgi:hypothetical protein
MTGGAGGGGRRLASGQEQELAAGLAAEAGVHSRAPVFEGEGRGDRHRQLAVGGQLPELGEHGRAVDGHLVLFVEAVADAEVGGGVEVGDGENPLGIAARDPDQVGQGASDRGGIQDQVGRAAAAEGADQVGPPLLFSGEQQ